MSMKKRSAESFEILSVEKKERKVVLSFSTFALSLTPSLFASGYYYPGKVLTAQEVEGLEEEIHLEQGRKRMEGALLRGRKTASQVVQLLSKVPGLTPAQQERLVEEGKREGLIDDRRYATEFALERKERGYGGRSIAAALRKKGIPPAILHEEDITKILEDTKIPSHLVERIHRSCKGETIEAEKKKMFRSLLLRGYPLSLVEREVESFLSRLDSRERESESLRRKELLREKGRKCYNQLMRTAMESQKRKERFFRRLSAEGFRYDEILSSWQENQNEGEEHD